MFTGIIEQVGEVKAIEKEKTNLHIQIESNFTSELKIDQSIAHNGCCLTVTEIAENTYWVTAIQETIKKTNISAWQVGDLVNLERCLRLEDRLDGHIVQGHVDAVGKVSDIQDEDGSWVFTIKHPNEFATVQKGSICVNGVSLTVVESLDDSFSVAIIPYTYEHTNFHRLKIFEEVNLEFDIVGKYIQKYLAKINS